MSRRLALALALLASVASAEDALVLERPAEVSEADWKATLAAFRSNRGALSKTLVEAAKLAPPPGADPETAWRGRRRMREVLEGGAVGLADAIAPTSAAINRASAEALVAPRLNGHVVRVGKGGDFATLFEALPSVRPGDTVKLLAGDHVALEDEDNHVPRWPKDVSFEGEGRGKTSLRTFVNDANRIRFAHMTLLGSEDEIFSLSDGCRLHLQDCVVREFNTKKGDNTGFHSEDGVLLVEDCEFRGLDAYEAVAEEDRAQRGGTAIMAAQRAIVVVRRTKFVDCEHALELYGAGSLDDCSGETTCDADMQVWTEPNSRVYVRNCPGLYLDESPGLFPLQEPGDDGGGEELRPDRNLMLCLGLTRHADPRVREAAKQRWSAMTLGAADPPAPPPAPPAAEVDAAFKALDSEDASVRDKSAAVLRAAGESVRARLKEATSAGSPELRGRAAALLSELDVQKEFGAEVEFAKRAAWYDEHEETLRWNDEKKGYEPKE